MSALVQILVIMSLSQQPRLLCFLHTAQLRHLKRSPSFSGNTPVFVPHSFPNSWSYLLSKKPLLLLIAPPLLFIFVIVFHSSHATLPSIIPFPPVRLSFALRRLRPPRAPSMSFIAILSSSCLSVSKNGLHCECYDSL